MRKSRNRGHLLHPDARRTLREIGFAAGAFLALALLMAIVRAAQIVFVIPGDLHS